MKILQRSMIGFKYRSESGHTDKTNSVRHYHDFFGSTGDILDFSKTESHHEGWYQYNSGSVHLTTTSRSGSKNREFSWK